ncbi:MAG TPA: hypothetical protein DEA96_05125 [Leptospiraceae bacterium]|nr:hypothetical protein [Spirochaetaceae bacterium]HBS04327.1 hypothetical protein [Leptospiraceae bacterium]
MVRRNNILLVAAVLISLFSGKTGLNAESPLWRVAPDSISPAPDTVDVAEATLEKRYPDGISSWQSIKVPGDLIHSGIGNSSSSAYYRFRLALPEKNIQYSIRLGEISDRDQVYFNGKPMASTGDWDATLPQAYDRIRIYDLPVGQGPGPHELLVQVRNQNNDELGIYRGQLEAGPSSLIWKKYYLEMIGQIALLSAYLVMALYFLFLFARRRVEREYLYFGLFLVFLVIYHFFRTQLKFELPLGFSTMKKLQYASLMGMVPTFYFFLDSFFRPTHRAFRWIRFGLTALILIPVIAWSLILLANRATDWEFWNQRLVQPSWIPYVMACFAILVTNLKKRDARLMILGFIALLVSMILDVLQSQALTNLPTLTPIGLAVFILGIAGVLANRFVRLNQELARTNESIRRFVPAGFLQLLGQEDITQTSLGDQVALDKIAVMFTDIREFTTLSESMTPAENFAFINSYYKRVGPVIRNHGGFIDKYLGDGFMALFPDGTDAALSAAIDMQENLVAYNAFRNQRNYRPIEVGVGIHTGRCILGLVGEQKRIDGTVISDSVNVASRLEKLTQQHRCVAIVSREAASALELAHRFRLTDLGSVQVRGRREPVDILGLGGYS